MDNTAQNPSTVSSGSNDPGNPSVSQQVQPVAQPVQQSAQPTDQTAPVAPQSVATPAGKESAPASNVADAVVIPKPEEQWIQETAPEAKVAQELQDAGVEPVKPEAVKLSPEVAQAGVVPTGPTIPIPTEPTLKLPIPEEKAQKVLLHKKVRDSLTWLAMLVIRQIKFMQLSRKEAKA